jgi:hypothetical protein
MVVRKPANLFLDELAIPYDDEGTPRLIPFLQFEISNKNALQAIMWS